MASIMSEEIINKVRVLDSGKLLLALKSGGKDSYQFIYREAAGVYWEKDLKGFISTKPNKWSYSEWFSHMVDVAKQIGIDLKLSGETDWHEVPEKEKEQILKAYLS